MSGNLMTPNAHMNVIMRQTFFGGLKIANENMIQDNRVGNTQKVGNARLTDKTNKGVLAGSVAAVVARGVVGPCLNVTTAPDAAVGVYERDANDDAFSYTNAAAAGKQTYVCGTGTIFTTDIYETVETDGTTPILYAAGDKIYASQNGLLTNADGLLAAVNANCTCIGLVLEVPTASNPFMTIQMRI